MKIALLGLVLLAQDGHDSRKLVRPLDKATFMQAGISPLLPASCKDVGYDGDACGEPYRYYHADPSADKSPAWLSMQDSTGEWIGNQVTPPAPMRGIRQDLTPCKPAGDSCEHSYLYIHLIEQDGNQVTPPTKPADPDLYWRDCTKTPKECTGFISGNTFIEHYNVTSPWQNYLGYIDVNSLTVRIIKLSTTEYERLEGLRKAVRDAEGEIAASHGVRTAPYCESGAALAHADDATFCPGAGVKMEWVKFPDHYEYRGAFLLVNVPEVAR